MKLKEYNALIGKLAKANPEKEVQMTYPGFLGNPEWDTPALVETKQNVFLVPQAVEDSIEQDHSPQQVANLIQKAYDERQAQSATQQSGNAA